MSIKFRVRFKILLLTYKALNDQAPSYLKELIEPYYPSRTLHSQNEGLLVVPRVSTSRKGAELSVFRLLCCGTIFQFGSRRQTLSPRLRLSLKPCSLIKLMVRTGSALAPTIPSLSCYRPRLKKKPATCVLLRH